MLSIKMINFVTAAVEKLKTKIIDTANLLDVVEPLTFELIKE